MKKIERKEEITQQEALGAYNTLKNYCRMQGSCDGCLLTIGEEAEDSCCVCLMEIQCLPRDWQLLDLD